jgi:hypothetical protein
MLMLFIFALLFFKDVNFLFIKNLIFVKNNKLKDINLIRFRSRLSICFFFANHLFFLVNHFDF